MGTTTRCYHNVHRGWWNGKWYDSSWELALIVYCHDHNIELTRNTRKFPYKHGKKIEYYQPDFLLEDGTYIEVKGIKDRKSVLKLNQFPYPIQMWGYDKMWKYISYMNRTYGMQWRQKFEAEQLKNSQ